MFAVFRFLFKSVAFLVIGLVMLILLGIPLGAWVYLHLNPARADATVLQKTEEIYHGSSGSWKHYFWLRVKYSPSDTRAPEPATIDVDEGTWDQSKAGSRVEIAYVPVAALRQIPMYYTKRLAEPLPPISRVPDVERSASAVVQKIRHITKVGGSSRSRGMTAWQPFDVVELSFIPAGRNEAVTALDMVDSGSVSNLVVGKPVAIDYSMRRPRAAKIVSASRDHEWKNNVEVYSFPGVAALVLLFFFIVNVRKSRRGSVTEPRP